jgi:xanthine dehydrogenase accessory factor
MKHWQEMGHVADRVLRLERERLRAAVAVVTRIEGSSYRRPGAKLLVEEHGDTVGGVSGGCLEQDVRHVGMAVLREGRSRTLHYDTYEDDSKVWGFGLGCDGKIDLVVLPTHRDGPDGAAAQAWAAVREKLRGDDPFSVSFTVEDGRGSGMLVTDRRGRLAGSLGDAGLDVEVEAAAGAALDAERSVLAERGGHRVFTEVLLPPPKLLICGAGDDAQPIAAFAANVGFRVLVADHRPAYLTRERFPAAQALLSVRPEQAAPELPIDRSTYAVLKTHSLQSDAAWTQRLLRTEAPYIGVLGPKRRIEKVLKAAGAAGSGRVFGPVGLDLGADGPEQVAMSVVAEVLAVASGRVPRHLREREGSLHART